MLLGLLEPAPAYLGDTFGLSRTSATDGAIISGLESALVVILAARVLGEAVSRATAIAIVLGLGGLVVMADGSGHRTAAGGRTGGDARVRAAAGARAGRAAARVERHGRKPLVARFGGIPLRRQKKAVITDLPQGPARPRRKELVTRLLAGQCEWCEQPGQVEAHQVRKLADLARPGQPQPAWAQLMARKRRKTLIVCAPLPRRHPCRNLSRNTRIRTPESRMPGNGHVRFGPGAAGKGPV